MTFDRIFLAVSVFAAVLALVIATPAQDSQYPQSISVVMDDNYPPYIFKDHNGELRGILHDEWHLWQKKTGIKVTISAMSWSMALAQMEEGKFDVIDTIFRNPKREKIYDFTQPYARLDVPIFFNKDISGISGLEDISGFIIGVKESDNVIDVIRASSDAQIKTFASYESIVQAAKNGSIKVFSIDRPPALYFLNKYNIADNFRETKPLYYGNFHRAVKKGNVKILNLVNNGFSRISKGEHSLIEKKWMGNPISSPLPIKAMLIAASIISGIIILLFLWVYILKRTVFIRTQELRDAKDEILTIYDSVNDGIMVHNSDGSIHNVNNRFCTMYGYTKSEMITMNVGDISSAQTGFTQEKALLILAQAKKDGPQTFEWMAKNKDNIIFPVEVSIRYTPIGGKDRYIASIRDITLRKTTEFHLNKSLDERESLLSELYHRTKNNMQVICSLFNLKSSHITDPGIQDIFHEMSNRIQTMALVHEKLYKSKDLSQINLREYISDLSDLLLKSYENCMGRVTIRLEVENIHVLLDTAVPCGLIINELITNSFKHAFPGERKGVITVIVRHIDDDQIEMIVSDNGIGFPEGFDREHSGKLGLKLIMSIGSQQLGGKINYSAHEGITSCRLIFSDNIFMKRI